MRKALLVLFFLCLAAPGFAASEYTDCGYTTEALASTGAAAAAGGADRRITPDESECFYFTGTEDSDAITVTQAALFTLFPDMGGAGAQAAAIDIQRCVPGLATYSANLCVSLLDTALDGTGGADGTQTASLRVGKGTYFIINSVTAGTEEAVVVIEGERE